MRQKRQKILIMFLCCLIPVFFLTLFQSGNVPSYHPSDTLTTEHAFIIKYQNSTDKSDKIIADYRRILKGLHYQQIIKLTPEFFQRDRERIMTTPFPSYAPPPTPKPKQLPISQIYFMQNTAWTLFHNNKYDVISGAKLFKTKKLSFHEVPEIHVWQDKSGKIWTLDHRRLVAVILAGNIKVIPVKWATEKDVLANKYEYTTQTQGKSIILYLTTRLGLVVSK